MLFASVSILWELFTRCNRQGLYFDSVTQLSHWDYQRVGIPKPTHQNLDPQMPYHRRSPSWMNVDNYDAKVSLYRQVGNAVCPVVSEVLGQCVMRMMDS